MKMGICDDYVCLKDGICKWSNPEPDTPFDSGNRPNFMMCPNHTAPQRPIEGRQWDDIVDYYQEDNWPPLKQAYEQSETPVIKKARDARGGIPL